MTGGFLPALSSAAQSAGPTVPQWAATIILLAALAAVILLFVFVLKAIKKDRNSRGR
ncbi:MAG: hypothetical protein ILO68_02380 [Clostridia bacterium]|nr:hypothetical protein [Clostridia bacterium]